MDFNAAGPKRPNRAAEQRDSQVGAEDASAWLSVYGNKL